MSRRDQSASRMLWTCIAALVAWFPTHSIWYALPKAIKFNDPSALPFDYGFWDRTNMWISMVISSLIAVAVGVYVYRRRKHPLQHCMRCGYDLQGTDGKSGKYCPECGCWNEGILA